MKSGQLSSSYIEVEELSLDEWLELMREPPLDATFADYQFPTDGHKSDYIAKIGERSEEEVLLLVRRFLIPTCTLGGDRYKLEWIKKAAKDNPEILRREWVKRLLFWDITKGKAPPPWEGITWIIDLLPHWPGEALKGLDAYFLAHAQQLPDGRVCGLSEAAELIRAKFIGLPGNLREQVNTLKETSPRVFEHLVERLYSKIGYETKLTPPSKDGGRDIIAWRTDTSKAEHLQIQCKRYESNVGVSYVRELLGVVSAEKVNKGVLVTTSNFTRPSKLFAQNNPRIELIHGQALVALMNEHLGARWPGAIERLVLESQKVHMREISL